MDSDGSGAEFDIIIGIIIVVRMEARNEAKSGSGTMAKVFFEDESILTVCEGSGVRGGGRSGSEEERGGGEAG